MPVYKVGERVRFLHEDQEGVVQEVVDHRNLVVLVDDFLELDVSVDEVVKINAGETVLLEEEEEEAKPKPEAKRVIVGTPSLVVLRDQNRDYQFWVLNPTSDELLFTAFYRVREKYRPLNAASVGPEDRFFMGRLSAQDFHNANQIHLTVLRFPRAGRIRPVPPFTLEVSVKKDIFNKKSHAIAEFEGEGYEFPFEEKPLEIELPDSDFVRVKPSQKQGDDAKPAIEVVDLHINKLVSNPARVDTRTMLSIQLEHFEKTLSDARLSNLHQIVFIHGIGSGQLKKRIHDYLRDTDWVERYSLADPIKYGNGATLVVLK